MADAIVFERDVVRLRRGEDAHLLVVRHLPEAARSERAGLEAARVDGRGGLAGVDDDDHLARVDRLDLAREIDVR